eukprot:SAG31_NODE_399_length_16247_cov_19.137540_7_plen_59_part_00
MPADTLLSLLQAVSTLSTDLSVGIMHVDKQNYCTFSYRHIILRLRSRQDADMQSNGGQ